MRKIIFLFLILFLSIMQVYAENMEGSNTGSITINKYDMEGKERIKANLSSSVFGIYKNRRLIKELKIGDSKTVTLKELDFGEYMVKEIQSGIGYDIDTNEYTITVDENNKNVVLNSYSKVIEGNLIINKYYGDDNNYNIDDDAVFEIYNNNMLIKIVSNFSETKLEYGDYLIRQISGKKCYEIIDVFSISIQQNKDYQYDLYTEKIAEIKEYEDLLKEQEENLKQREEELKKWENDIEKENNSLKQIKEEIDNKSEELALLENELNKKENDIKILEGNLEKDENEINILKENVNNYYKEIEYKKEELQKNKVEQNIKEEEIKERENTINKIEKELEILGNELKEKQELLNNKEKKLINLENDINNRELDLNKKEQELIKLENKKEDVLVVEVPNTSKNNYNKLISIILIFIGSIFILYSKKKVTNH